MSLFSFANTMDLFHSYLSPAFLNPFIYVSKHQRTEGEKSCFLQGFASPLACCNWTWVKVKLLLERQMGSKDPSQTPSCVLLCLWDSKYTRPSHFSVPFSPWLLHVPEAGKGQGRRCALSYFCQGLPAIRCGISADVQCSPICG